MSSLAEVRNDVANILDALDGVTSATAHPSKKAPRNGDAWTVVREVKPAQFGGVCDVAMVAAVCLGPDELVAEARFDALAALAVNAISRGIASHSVVGRSEVMPATDANQAPVFVLTISFNTECEAP